jgi:hypothetical protein
VQTGYLWRETFHLPLHCYLAVAVVVVEAAVASVVAAPVSASEATSSPYVWALCALIVKLM